MTLARRPGHPAPAIASRRRPARRRQEVAAISAEFTLDCGRCGRAMFARYTRRSLRRLSRLGASTRTLKVNVPCNVRFSAFYTRHLRPCSHVPCSWLHLMCGQQRWRRKAHSPISPAVGPAVERYGRPMGLSNVFAVTQATARAAAHCMKSTSNCGVRATATISISAASFLPTIKIKSPDAGPSVVAT
jgi:hypothetical protein